MMSSVFDTVHQCDRQMDSHRATQCHIQRYSYASRDKNRENNIDKMLKTTPAIYDNDGDDYVDVL